MRTISFLISALVLTSGACSSGPSGLYPNMNTQVFEATASEFCSAFAVIQQKCVRCHSNPPVNGAPFPLDSYEATQVPSRSGDEIRADRMRQAIESGYMPLTTFRLDPPVEGLTCEERATILAWLDDGAPPPRDADPTCENTTPSLAACAGD